MHGLHCTKSCYNAEDWYVLGQCLTTRTSPNELWIKHVNLKEYCKASDQSGETCKLFWLFWLGNFIYNPLH